MSVQVSNDSLLILSDSLFVTACVNNILRSRTCKLLNLQILALPQKDLDAIFPLKIRDFLNCVL